MLLQEYGKFIFTFLPRELCLARSILWPFVYVSVFVCLSATSRRSTKMAKCSELFVEIRLFYLT